MNYQKRKSGLIARGATCSTEVGEAGDPDKEAGSTTVPVEESDATATTVPVEESDATSTTFPVVESDATSATIPVVELDPTEFILPIFCRSTQARAISPWRVCRNATLSLFAETRVACWKLPIWAFLPGLPPGCLMNRAMLQRDEAQETKQA
jgi:hypothetical protein